MRIEGGNPALFNLPQQHNTHASAEQARGQWRGENVQVGEKANSSLTDAAEEMTFAHSERAEKTRLENRNVRAAGIDRLAEVEKLIDYLNQTGTGDADAKLEELVKKLLDQHRDNPGGAKPREDARQQFGDVAGQYAALVATLARLKKSGASGALTSAIEDAIDNLEDDFGGEIKANLNTVAPATAFAAGDGAKLQAFQGAYKDAVMGDGTLAGTMRQALKRFGDSDFSSGVKRLIQALGDDLGAQGPSADPNKLKAVLEDLYQLEVLTTVHDASATLIGRIQRQHGNAPSKPGDMMQELVSASGERWVAASRFASYADKLATGNITMAVQLLTGWRALVSGMPPKVFADGDARMAVVGAIQEAMNSAIAREESGQ
jgi:type III secretion protein W